MPIMLIAHELARQAATVASMATRMRWQPIVLAVVAVVFLLPSVIYVLTHPALLRRRLHLGPLAEPDPAQKVIITLLVLCYFASIVVSELDLRNGWSQVPVPVALMGDLLIALGLLVVWQVYRANPFAAATVRVESEQTVIATGPYALVRHPMYSGILLILLGIPLGLGSWWGTVFYVPLLALIIWRLTREEAYLSKRLPGYSDYRAHVRYRLIPRVW